MEDVQVSEPSQPASQPRGSVCLSVWICGSVGLCVDRWVEGREGWLGLRAVRSIHPTTASSPQSIDRSHARADQPIDPSHPPIDDERRQSTKPTLQPISPTNTNPLPPTTQKGRLLRGRPGRHHPPAPQVDAPPPPGGQCLCAFVTAACLPACLPCASIGPSIDRQIGWLTDARTHPPPTHTNQTETTTATAGAVLRHQVQHGPRGAPHAPPPLRGLRLRLQGWFVRLGALLG